MQVLGRMRQAVTQHSGDSTFLLDHDHVDDVNNSSLFSTREVAAQIGDKVMRVAAWKPYLLIVKWAVGSMPLTTAPCWNRCNASWQDLAADGMK